MKGRRVVGLVMVIAALTMIGFSIYIDKRVLEGRGQISDAQRKVDQGTGLFDLNPVTKEVGKELSAPIKGKIRAAALEADDYERMAKWLKIGGITLLILGVIVMILPKRRL